MEIGIDKIPYEFLDFPIVLGGKAMEYYGLRKAGNDIDLIISERDFENLEKILPRHSGIRDIDHFIRYKEFEMWTSIRQFNYEFYQQKAVRLDGFCVVSIERLVWLKALYVSEEKSINDLKLLSKYIMLKQYKKYLKKNANQLPNKES